MAQNHAYQSFQPWLGLRNVLDTWAELLVPVEGGGGGCIFTFYILCDQVDP